MPDRKKQVDEGELRFPQTGMVGPSADLKDTGMLGAFELERLRAVIAKDHHSSKQRDKETQRKEE